MTGYTLALVLVCAAGVLLVRDLCRKNEPGGSSVKTVPEQEELYT